MHTGVKKRRKLKDICTVNKNFFGGVAEFFENLEELMTNDEQVNNQQDTDEKLRQLNQKEATKELLKMMGGAIRKVELALPEGPR